MDIECIRDELHRLTLEEELINKALQAVRLARQKNNIELMEVLSKIKELQQMTSKNITQRKNFKKSNRTTTVVNETRSIGVKDIDNPSIVNQTKLNLSIGQNMNIDQEEESEESD
jgi:hypothetical protein